MSPPGHVLPRRGAKRLHTAAARPGRDVCPCNPEEDCACGASRSGCSCGPPCGCCGHCGPLKLPAPFAAVAIVPRARLGRVLVGSRSVLSVYDPGGARIADQPESSSWSLAFFSRGKRKHCVTTDC
eukprot:6172373-Prymnesium_polylepis.2